MRPDPIAIHEAGHAVAAWRLGALNVHAWPHPVPMVEDSAGACLYLGVIPEADHAVIALAGRAAERHLLGAEQDASAYRSDEADALAEAGTGTALTVAGCRAAAFVIRHRREIFSLSARLQTRGVVMNSDLAEVCGCAPGIDRQVRQLADIITQGLAEYRASRKRKAKR